MSLGRAAAPAADRALIGNIGPTDVALFFLTLWALVIGIAALLRRWAELRKRTAGGGRMAEISAHRAEVRSLQEVTRRMQKAMKSDMEDEVRSMRDFQRETTSQLADLKGVVMALTEIQQRCASDGATSTAGRGRKNN